VEKFVVEWEKRKAEERQKELREVEEDISKMFENNDSGIFSEELQNLKRLEGIKKGLLEKEEAKWKLKNRAIWLAEGDENTKFFQNYARHRKNTNTIWENSIQVASKFKGKIFF
jgi:hypothetical protein